MTAYYMSRQVFLVFYGEARWKKADAKSPAEAEAKPEHEPAAAHGGHGGDGADSGHGDFKPHESPGTMTFPLVVLAVLAVVAGILKSPLERWLETVLAHPHHVASTSSTKLGLIVVTTVAALAGVGIAASIWLRG
jgi:NADH-quinone oxidoreductase subunit L